MMKRLNYAEEYVLIGGIEQYLLHYPGEKDAAVVLYLHGGPGQSYSSYAYYLMQHWGGNKTYVFWDQRGAGKTLIKKPGPENIPTKFRMLDDMYEVVQYLKKKYGVHKIIIMAHSWGTRLGTLFIRKYPQETEYYIGICQCIGTIDHEKRNYEKVYQEICTSKNREDLETIKDLLPYPEECFSEQMTAKTVKLRKIQKKYGLISGLNDKFVSIMSASPVFSVNDMISIVNAAKFNEQLVESLYSESLLHGGNRYEVPIFYILGDNDWELSYTLAEEYFRTIKAPVKRLFLMKGCAHVPMLEAPHDFADILLAIENEDLLTKI